MDAATVTSTPDLHNVLPKLSLDDVLRNGGALPTPPPDVDADAYVFGTDASEARSVSPQPAWYKFERAMGNSELSYFLPSRADGVNDMYLHLGMRSASKLLTPARLETVWALLRLRHPLLASAVEMGHGDYENVRFVYAPPASVKSALNDAHAALTWRSGSKDEMINDYLNGPRTLSNDRLSALIVSTSGSSTSHGAPATPPPTPSLSRPGSPSSETEAEADGGESATLCQDDEQVDILIAAAHFIGDGMALHMFANDLLQLLAGSDGASTSSRTDEELLSLLTDEWEARWGDSAKASSTFSLPCALEDGLPTPPTRLRRTLARVDFLRDQHRCIGGHSFPKPATKRPRHTVVSTVSFDPDTTKRMLKKCKSHGVSISAALFAVCNIAALRTQAIKQSPELPMMAYSAINLRPQLTSQAESYWFLAVGYFNVILPAFLPSSLPEERIFWHRARSAKAQSAKANGLLLRSRAQQMAEERGRRARRWAREDDGQPADEADADVKLVTGAESTPSRALVGLSLLGNLDGMYKHASYGSLKLHSLTTGSRQRSGGMLIFGYTFVGKLWLSLGWDMHGFDQASVEGFWNEFVACTKEFLDAAP